MAQIERAYANCPTTLVVPLASTHATRCSQHRPPFALVRLLRCGAAARGDCRRGNSSGSRILSTPLGRRSESVMTELVSVRDCVLLLFLVRATYSPAPAHMMELEEKEALNAMEKFEIKTKRLVNRFKPRPTPLTVHAPQSL